MKVARQDLLLPTAKSVDPISSTKSTGYLVETEILGGGLRGIVQKGVSPRHGLQIAVKRVECDPTCPMRFLEVWVDDRRDLVAEGFAPVHSPPVPWGAALAYHASNEFAAQAFAAGTLENKIALVRRGGGVTFAAKVAHARSGGAVGVLIINTEDELETFTVEADQLLVPCMMIDRSDGELAIQCILESQAMTDGLRRESRTDLHSQVHARVRTDVSHEVMICKELPPHPNVVEILDVWEDGDAAVVVMPMCTGGHVVPPHDLSSALWLIRQMLAGLAHLHAHGVVHRDLKPENMLLTHPLADSDARLVLVDFSMASTAPRTTVPCGTLLYLAPEVLAGSYGPKRDLWSAGVIAHELIFKRHPFGALGEAEVLQRLRHGPAPEVGPPPGGCPGDDVPEAVVDLLQQLLHTNPAKRPTAAEALQHSCLQEASLRPAPAA